LTRCFKVQALQNIPGDYDCSLIYLPDQESSYL
jgi:hypothetical protein